MIRGAVLLLASGLTLAAAVATPAAALSPFDVARSDVAPRYDAERDVLCTTAVGVPAASIDRLSAARLSGRRRAVARARAALHDFADDAMAEARVRPRVAERVHRAIDRDGHVGATRALVEGGAVVVYEVPGAALREASRGARMPWRAR